LAIGLHGWVRFPLKVWTTLVLLTTEEWNQFIALKKIKDKADFFIQFMFFFEVRGDLLGPDITAYSNWLEIMDNALLRRQATYGEFADFDAFQTEILETRTEVDTTVHPPPFLPLFVYSLIFRTLRECQWQNG
jgi:hypothetical protein